MSHTNARIQHLAKEVSRVLTPHKVPTIEGIGISATPNSDLSCPGSVIDIVTLSEERIDFLFFETAEIGPAGALISAAVKTFFFEKISHAIGPSSIIDSVLQKLDACGLDWDIRSFYATLNLHNNKLVYCNPGNLPVFMYRCETAQAVWLTTQTFGYDPSHGTLFQEKTEYLNPVDLCVLLSATNDILPKDGNEEIAERKIREVIKKSTSGKNAALSVDEKLNSLLRALEATDGGCRCNALMMEVLGHSRRNIIKKELGFDMQDPVYIQMITYFEEIDRTSSVILRDMDELGYSDESIRKMKVVLTELLANAIYHGNRKDYSKKITLGHVCTKDYTRVSVMDEGEGFDMNELPDPTLPENLEKDCGRGVFIVRNYADRIETNEKGNRITICKRR